MANFDRTAAETFLIQMEEKGDLLSNFKLTRENGGLKLLGIGGFASVYEMHSVDNPDKKYALKVIGLSDKKVSSNRFVNTNHLQISLGEKSSKIVRILQFFEKEDLQFVLSEELQSVINKDKFQNNTLYNEKLTRVDEILKYAKDIGSAIKTAHDNNILHRDIKLENTFWDEESGEYKLGDFGIAKFVDGGNAETVVFTDGYGAPEIERHLVDYYNATADIYSFGITLFLLLNNLRFPASDGYYVSLVQYSDDYIMPAAANATEGLTRIIRKMCSYRMEDRYQSMDEVLVDLNRLRADGTCESDELAIDLDELDDLETVTYSEEAPKEIYVEKIGFDDGLEQRNIRREKYYTQKQRYNIELIIGCLVLLAYNAAWLLGGEHGRVKLDVVGTVCFVLTILKGVMLRKRKRTIVINILLIVCVFLMIVNGRSAFAFIEVLPILISNSGVIVAVSWIIGSVYGLIDVLVDHNVMYQVEEYFRAREWILGAFFAMILAMIVINVSRTKLYNLKNRDK